MNEEKEKKKHFSTPKVDVNFESSSSSSAEGKTEAPLRVRWHIVVLLSSPRRDWRCQFVSSNLGWLFGLTRLLLFRKARLGGDFGRPGRLQNSPFVVFYRLNAKFHISNGIDLFVTETVCDLEENPALLMLSSTCVFPFMTNMKMHRLWPNKAWALDKHGGYPQIL